MDFKVMLRSKTFWAGVVGIVTAVGAYATGTMELGTMAQTVFGCLVAIFLRDGMIPK